MTYVVRIRNPQMPDRNSAEPRAWIGPGELSALVGKIFEDRAVPYKSINVSWEEPEKFVEDPFRGQREDMISWLNKHVAMGINEVEDRERFISTINLAKTVRDEWMSRGYTHGKYIALKYFVEVARQVRNGWKS